jgi:hypothetical protein
MEKIQFETNIPQEVALKMVHGKEQPSRFGPPELMFITTDERVLFLPREAGEAIHVLRPAVGDRVRICRMEIPQPGRRKEVQWSVSKVEGSQAAASTARLAPAGGVQPITSQPVNGNGSRPGGAGAPPAGKNRDVLNPGSMFLLQQTKQLIGVYHAALVYAAAEFGTAVGPDQVRELMLAALEVARRKGAGDVV